MKRIAFPLLAVISLTCAAAAATRPHYGGTLRVAMQSAPTTFEIPATNATTDYWDMTHLLSLIGDTLVTIDALGRPQPALALSWQNDPTCRHWQFDLHRGVEFHDGSPASATAIAQILAVQHPDWTLRPSGDSLTIDIEIPSPSLLAELALPRNLVLKHNPAGIPIGTGAFRVVDFQPEKSLKLAASEDSWSGRPFLDAIEIDFGKSLRDQAVALDIGRIDLVEAPPQAATASTRIRSSLPVELMALVFPPDSKAQDSRLRQSLALSIDRKPIQSVLLKGAAEPTGSLLPNWMTGYGPVFPIQPDPQKAKVLLADLRPPALTLSYDPRDPQAQLIAERIALNAREVGITIQVSLTGADDLRLVRIALPTPDPALALREAARQLSLPLPVLHASAIEDLYLAEKELLDSNGVIPLFHIPIASASSSRLRSWNPDRLGQWNLPDVWLDDVHPGDSR